VNAPPRIGPKAIPSWPIPMFMPRNWACFLRGNITEMIVMAPFPIPDDPAPAMALPTMNMGDETAAPQMTDPSSKRKKKTRKDHCFHR
jgi:hypothetical protein